MKEIHLTQGFKALVDDEDYEFLIQYKWSVRRDQYKKGGFVTHYARRGVDGERMHRVLLVIAGTKLQGDHIDGDGLNNQRHNLRPVTISQNQMNSRKRTCASSSVYKGVYLDKLNNKWGAGIVQKGTRINLGRFVDEKEAALAYNTAAREYFGEYACLNVIE